MQKIIGTKVKTGAFAIALALVGCGGGGGGGDSAPGAGNPVAATPAPTERTIRGTAAKGLIKGAKVSIHALDAQGARGADPVATTTTGANGSFSMQLATSVRNFVIEVSAAPGAVMADEASGADIAVPQDMKLRNVVTLADNASGLYEGTVSPLTEMVTRTAQTADGKLPQQAVVQAKAYVRTMLGFDPETVKPVNSNSAAAATASEDEKNQSLALAAISKMGSSASADCAQASAGERISCVVDKLAGSVQVTDGRPTIEQNRLARFREAVHEVTQDRIINRTGKDKVVGIPVLTQEAPAPVQATASQLDATKALFGSLRTNLRAFNEGDTFRTTAAAIKADLAGAVAPLGNDASGLATLVSSAVDHMHAIRNSSFYQLGAAVHGNVVGGTSIMYDIVSGEGQCAIVEAPLSMTCAVVHRTDLPGTMETSPARGTLVYAVRYFTIEPVADSATNYRYATWLQKATAQTLGSIIDGEPAMEMLGDVNGGVITSARDGNGLTQLTVMGTMAGRVDSDGALGSDYEAWTLNVARSQEAAGTWLYKFGGKFIAVKAGQRSGTVQIDDTSFARVALSASSGGKIVPNAASELQMTLHGNLGDTAIDGTLRAWDNRQDASKTTYVPTRLSFDGSLKHKDALVFSGKASLQRNGYERYNDRYLESDTNFIADTLEVNGTLSAPNRRTLQLTLGATRIGKDAASISAQYSDGTSVINASVTARAGQDNPLVKVSSADGVAFSFTDKSVPVSVTKDGAAVAKLDLVNGTITYIDGTTESLK